MNCPKCNGSLQRIDQTTEQCTICGEKFVLPPSAVPPQQPTSVPTNETQTANGAPPTYVAPQQANAIPPISDVAPMQNAQSETTATPDADEMQRTCTDFKAQQEDLLRRQNEMSAADSGENGATAPKRAKAKINLKTLLAILLPSVLVAVVFITLMVCLVGVRGVYVNVNDPNDFMSFTATSYEAYYEDEFGDMQMEKGSWKTSDGKLVLTVKDEDFGKISSDFKFSKKDASKTIFVDDVEYRRVSLLSYATLSKKVTVAFNPNGASGETDTKTIKQGNMVESPDAPTREGYTFYGWYTDPLGYIMTDSVRFSTESRRIWEDMTFYANWYNNTEYTISFGLCEVTAHENDLLLPMIKNAIGEYADNCKFYINNVLIDDNTRMPAANTTVSIVGPLVFCPISDYTEYSVYASPNFSLTSCTLPKSYCGKPVTRIEDYSRYSFYSLQSITIPDTINQIADAALCFFPNLTTITVESGNTTFHSSGNCVIETATNTVVTGCKNSVIPTDGSVTAIGDYAFSECIGLLSITIPSNVTSIGESAFSNCFKLVEVFNKSTLPITVGSSDHGKIAYYARNVYTTEGGSKLSTEANGYVTFNDGANKVLVEYTGTATDLTLPNDLTEINQYVFYKCSNLKSIVIGDNITAIGESAFSSCKGLTSVTIPNNVKSIGYSAFCFCENLISATIGDGVTDIGSSAFGSCPNLISITLGRSVTNIGVYAFNCCVKLIEVYNKSALPITYDDTYGGIGSYALNIYTTEGGSKLSTDANGYILYTDGAEKLIIGYSGSATDLTLPNGVTNIFYKAFELLDIESVIIPDSVITISKDAFCNCFRLKSVTIGKGVTDIQRFAFLGSNKLKNVTFLDTETWYLTNSYENSLNKTGGEQIDVSNAQNNTSYFKEMPFYYFYKK